MAKMVWILLCFLSIAGLRLAFCSPPPAPSASCPGRTTGPLYMLREALPFCGGKVGSPTCCTREQDAKLHGSFLDELKKHDYHDTLCRSTLKGAICAVCLPSAPANKLFSNTIASKNDESSLPLHCTALSVSIHDLTPPSTEPPTPEWLLADDDNKASTTPKWLIGLIASVLALLGVGGYIIYKIHKGKLECCNRNQCCSNINCCLCLP